VETELRLLASPMKEVEDALWSNFTWVLTGLAGVISGIALDYYVQSILKRVSDTTGLLVERINILENINVDRKKTNLMLRQRQLQQQLDQLASAELEPLCGRGPANLRRDLIQQIGDIIDKRDALIPNLTPQLSIVTRNWPAITSFVAGLGAMLYGALNVVWLAGSNWDKPNIYYALENLKKLLDNKIKEIEFGFCLNLE
jgi:hypothetical protein